MQQMETQIDDMTLEDLYKELGFTVFTYIETANMLERLQERREILHNKIKEKQYEYQSMDSQK